ncbi:phosphatase PAP2 family protein [Rossellomorea vietnamensis]|uniref:Phosphatase PAP2 family protein n=1 Tax=Rossellomorea vietnamensis TaxID=218284 RepID=A0A5D4KJG4_9BACI|nr:phosphatase PAP2 family protein [Rossellomorea vietnamensis]TYR76423.1 phosphatase PAP2 family protein [Rossellomorea vietnamensis]
MERVRSRIFHYDESLFYHFNGHQGFILSFFHMITHLGGARFTISAMLVMYLLAEQGTLLRKTVIIAMLALTVSHLIAAGIKKLVKRIRPYAALPNANLYGHQFKDHSFPSGHTTAVFSITAPFMIHYPALIMVLLPVSLLTALSRVVLGVHYPSDILAGSFLGTVTAVLILIQFY